MKIHESMNVLLHKSTILFALLCATLFNSFVGIQNLSAQAPTLQIHDLVMVKNDTLEFQFDTYHSYLKPQKMRPTSTFPAYDYSRFNSPTGSKKFGKAGINEDNTIFYMPPTGFVGRDTIEILRWIEGPGYSSLEAYIILNITVVPSQITAMPDYVAMYMGNSMEIDVLVNDYGNGTNQKIAEVTNRNRGDAQLNADSTKVIFTPTSGFEGISHFNYSICDAQGACDMTTVSICVMNPNPPAYDSISVQTKEEETQVILMALDSGYTITTSPQNGVATDTGDVWTYVPNAGYVGNDKVRFEDASNNRIRVFQIEVIGPAPYEPQFLKDDIVYTPVDETIEEIHLLANDNGGTYLSSASRVNEWSNGDTKEGGDLIYLPYVGKGVYQYIPPAGFSGVDYFRYKGTVPGGGLTDTATCYIIVDDLKPAQPVYQLGVPENTPLVLGDHLPFLNYDYQITAAPSNGTLDYFPGYHTYTSPNGQEFSGYNMLIYEPTGNTGDTDAFEVEYCPAYSANCELAKVDINIINIVTPQSDTLCAGTDCVWPGDADHNGKIDINDLLPIGLCMGEVGENRTVDGSEYYAQYATEWNSLFRDNLDFDVKHVDTDGNGIVSSMDTTAIGQFYGQYNDLVPTAPAPLSELPFYPDPFPGNPQPGDVILIPLNLGNTNIPAFDAYGLTFNVDYDPSFFESVNVYWNDDAWMNYNSPILSMSHKPYPGRLDVGYTRTSGLAATGHGVIGVLEFIVVDDLIQYRPNEAYSTINIGGNLMNSGGQQSNLGEHSLSFSFGINEEGQDEELNGLEQDHLFVYPNPSTDILNVHLNGQDNIMERIALYNVVGSQVYDSGNILAKRTRLDVAGLNPGIYVMRVWSNGEVMTKKVEVMR